VKEIRWHARAGQGAKTASQLLAVALLREGKSVQAFPEYGPERRGAPMRAYTRIDEKPIRRHDSIEEPDVVVVLEPSLLHDPAVTAGLAEDGVVVANSPDAEPGVICIPAGDLAPARSVNMVMLGALAAVLGQPAIDDLVEAAREVLGKKADPDALRAALEAGHAAALEEELKCLTA
jgi:pyruvate ferredoxin oxidoreductase gamma subunit